MLALLPMIISACGPPRDEVLGQTAVFATPFIFLLGLLIHYLHFRMQANRSAEIKIDWRPSIFFLLISFTTICVLAQSSVLEEGEGYLSVAIMFGGFSYTVLLYILTAFLAQFAPRVAFTWTPLLLLIFFVVPAIPLTLSPSSGSTLAGLVLILWLLPAHPVALAILAVVIIALTIMRRRQ